MRFAIRLVFKVDYWCGGRFNCDRTFRLKLFLNAFKNARAGVKLAQLNDSSCSPYILFSIFRISNGLRYGHKQTIVQFIFYFGPLRSVRIF